MNTENPQSFILKSVKELAAISEESVINTSALCRLLEIDANNVRQFFYSLKNKGLWVFCIHWFSLTYIFLFGFVDSRKTKRAKRFVTVFAPTG